MFSNLFPRENLVGGTKRLKNLSELLSSTVLKTPSYGPEYDLTSGAVTGSWHEVEVSASIALALASNSPFRL